jgi:hypothetical protein
MPYEKKQRGRLFVPCSAKPAGAAEKKLFQFLTQQSIHNSPAIFFLEFETRKRESV